jgi:arylsulfatase A-like enzyme
MMRGFRLYGDLLRPWATVAVYLWALQLVFDFAMTDPEPLLDRLADCSAILWTILFWTAFGVGFICFTAPLVGRIRLVDWNSRIVKVLLILITAVAFVRWLFNWASLLGNSKLIFPVLILLSFILSLWVWRRRSHSQRRESRRCLPSLGEGWAFLTLPILICSSVIVVFAMGKHAAILYGNRTELRSVLLKSPSENLRQLPNVVLIVADALRVNNMSLYGYQRKTTPFLERLAESGAAFTDVYTTSTSTRPSLTSILSGKHPFSHGRLTKFLPIYAAPENLVRLLRQTGYTTAAVTSNVDAMFYNLGLRQELVHGEYPNFRRLTLSWLRDNGVYPTSPGNRMYDELAQFLPFLGFPAGALGYGPAESTLRIASDLMERLQEPFFLFIHLHEPHDPYFAPAPFRNKYASLDHDDVNRKIPSGYYSRFEPELQAYVDSHRDRYDEAIEYLDFQLSQFFQRLKRRGMTTDPLLIITADHGESFERGFLNHGDDLYETSIRVPLIIQFPGQHVGYRSAVPVQLIDIAPTILRAAGIPIPHWSDGVALNLGDATMERYSVVVNYKDPDREGVYTLPTQLTIIYKRNKLIVNCRDGRAELYDLAQDPGESKDLAKQRVEMLRTLWAQLQGHLAMQGADRKMTCDFHPEA